ncbi:sterol desaturase family protein [Fluviispira multicolorata]|uniref:Sterol desaturase family protein n=1 Tax=Fluviispira multicolorata TaxID=2654512 RepID=A0A833JC75_9BACT|nr:sterol desaturase family protein [Fluviispira multicolorata]KAB8029812.1 sterol desaturase family protein [Fluviispira multicolorata]
MDMFLLYTIPIYNLAIAVEYFYVRKKIPNSYFIKDTIASLSMGIGFLIISGLCNIFVFKIFTFFNNYSLFQIPYALSAIVYGEKINWLVFLLLIFAEDFCYYWFHRISHICRFFWCAHETHHSSVYYNFGTALRQTWLGSPFTWIFWAPLAILGFRAEDILLQSALNLFYQFWVHTRLTKSFGAFDSIFNTPSHHRVHHGSDIAYLDKNYAGIFIIWDKIFKTFHPEDNEPIYGVLHPIRSFNPFIIGLHMLKELYLDIKSANQIRDKVKYLYKPPGWNHLGTGKISRDLQNEYYYKNLKK